MAWGLLDRGDVKLGGKKLFLPLLGLLVIGLGVFLAQSLKGKKGGEQKEVQVKRAVSYVPLETFVVNLRGGINFLKVTMTLEVEGLKEGQDLKDEMPVIRHNIIFILTEKGVEDIITSEGKRTLAEEIKQKVNEVFSPKEVKVTGVYFTEFIVQ